MFIAEFVEVTGLSRDAVRLYVKRGLLNPQVLSNGYQHFGDAEIERVVLIQTAQSLGFTIKQMVSFAAEFDAGTLSHDRQIMVLAEQLSVLEQQAKRLSAMRTYLKKKIAWMRGGEIGPPPNLLQTRRARFLRNDATAACLPAAVAVKRPSGSARSLKHTGQRAAADAGGGATGGATGGAAIAGTPARGVRGARA